MIRLRQKDIERLAIITDGSVDYLTKLVSMRRIEITDHHSKNVDVKNLRVSLYMCKHIKVPKGLTLKDLRGRKEYIGRKFVLKVDYSDKKENV